VAAGEVELEGDMSRHVGECLRCQAELAAYRRILRHLRSLRHDEIAPPPGTLSAVLDALAAAGSDGDPATSRVLRVAYVGGITVVTAAAGAAGVLVWMNRRRVGLTQTG
jgi:hypothetical protein